MKSLTGITVLLLILPTCLHGYPELSGWFKKFNNITCKADVTLYTPVNAEQPCFRDALECFREGLHTVLEECSEDQDQENTIETINEFLKRTAKQMKTSKPMDKCACNMNEKKPFQVFRMELKRLTKRVNSRSLGQ